MKFKIKLWKRENMSFSTTVPHIVLLNLDPVSKDYKVVLDFNERVGE